VDWRANKPLNNNNTDVYFSTDSRNFMVMEFTMQNLSLATKYCEYFCVSDGYFTSPNQINCIYGDWGTITAQIPKIKSPALIKIWKHLQHKVKN